MLLNKASRLLHMLNIREKKISYLAGNVSPLDGLAYSLAEVAVSRLIVRRLLRGETHTPLRGISLRVTAGCCKGMPLILDP